MTSYGKVYLIGAGPGAVDLITVRGMRLLAQADVVLYDALVTRDMLQWCPQAITVAVGKRCGGHAMAQTDINRQLIDYAKKYPRIVRLKGGDPMLFGRADEELRALEEAGIEIEIVPGITAALAAAASCKQPLTQRGVARSVAFFTACTATDRPAHIALPQCDTLVQYMGGREAIATAHRLQRQGHPATLPVLVVENCSLENERIMRLSLGELEHGLPLCQGPVLVMIGQALAARPHASTKVQAHSSFAHTD